MWVNVFLGVGCFLSSIISMGDLERMMNIFFWSCLVLLCVGIELLVGILMSFILSELRSSACW